MCIPVQVGGTELHWPGFTHSILRAPCSSWPSSHVKLQTIPSGCGVTVEAGEDGEGLQLILALVGISGAGHPNTREIMICHDLLYSVWSTNRL